MDPYAATASMPADVRDRVRLAQAALESAHKAYEEAPGDPFTLALQRVAIRFGEEAKALAREFDLREREA